MEDYIKSLKNAGIGDLSSQDGIPIKRQKIYGHIHIVGLEGGDYHFFITELDSATGTAF